MSRNDLADSNEALNCLINSKETSKLISNGKRSSKTYLSNELLINNNDTQDNQTTSRQTNKCPTCNGTGKVNKDEQHKLVALIPLDDNRLKPKRIWLWILGTVVSCGLIAIALTFLFVPRPIQITNDLVNVEPFNITYITGMNTSKVFGIAIFFNEKYRIQNDNFYEIKMSNLTLELTRISHVTDPELFYDKNVPISPRSSSIINVKVKYTMYTEDDPYTDLCIKNIINQLFTLISTSFSFSTLWNGYEESHLKTMQYLTCNNASKYPIA